MNAAVVHSFDKPPHFGPFPEPVAGEHEVLIHVRAAALKPVDKQLASGSHYGSKSLTPPFVCGIDGVGNLEDGSRMFFVMPRSPYGAMAERTVAPRSFCFPIPDNIDDCTAAAIFNPGLSAWLSLVWRAQLAAGETVLILGATGVTGKLAIQTAKLLGAGRVIAAGRNEEVLSTLPDLGADTIIRLQAPHRDLSEVFAREAGEKGIDVIIDYVWGEPTEALIGALTRGDLKPTCSRVRLVQAGESAGPVIALRAAALRSSRLELLGAGSGSAPPAEMFVEARRQLMSNVTSGKLRIETDKIPVADIEDAWRSEPRGRRLVIVP
jgi:NADPH:quinone reductase-like Zn-dependent oxidoreductase